MRLAQAFRFFAVLFACGSASREALAAPPDDDVLTPLDAREIQHDVRIASRDEPPEGTPLWLSLAGSVASTASGYEGLGILSLGGTLERFAGPPIRSARAKELPRQLRGAIGTSKALGDPDEPSPGKARSIDAGTDANHKSAQVGDRASNAKSRPPQDRDTASEAPSSPPPAASSPRRPVDSSNEPPPITPRLDGAFARGLVRAARVAARTLKTEQRLDALATRARASGLLPELRFRVARVTNDTQTLSPLEYDPTRTTASGGTGLWLEGRATFRLDRLVFADDEVGIERIRTERDRMDRALALEVLTELAVWQKAAVRAADPTMPDDDRITAEINQLSAAAALDVLSDGWFTAHLPADAR